MRDSHFRTWLPLRSADRAEDEARLSPFQSMDPDTMKVAELRVELSRRGAETAGLKAVLKERLKGLIAAGVGAAGAAAAASPDGTADGLDEGGNDGGGRWMDVDDTRGGDDAAMDEDSALGPQEDLLPQVDGMTKFSLNGVDAILSRTPESGMWAALRIAKNGGEIEYQIRAHATGV